jgi:formylglycine-generating enzyme required for sulfatase activity
VTQSTPSTNPLKQFIAFTQAKHWDLDSYQIADIIWWYQQKEQYIQDSAHPLDSTPPPSPYLPPSPSSSLPLPPPPSSNSLPPPPDDAVGVTPPIEDEDRSEKIKGDSLPVSLPDASFLRDTLILGRIARPIIQKVDSATQRELDIQRTVNDSAEYSLGSKSRQLTIIPAHRAKKARSLDVILIVEEWESMLFWKEMALEVRNWLEQLGAFRDIKLCRMGWREDQNKVEITPFFSNIQTINPKDLNHSRGERLILFFSDCTSPAWYQGCYNKTLKEWGTHQLVTLLSPFPERLWERTALSQGWEIQLQNDHPRRASQEWKIASMPDLLQIELEFAYEKENPKQKKKPKQTLKQYIDQKILTDYFPLPILCLTPESLAAWAQVVSGNREAGCAGRYLAISPKASKLPETLSPKNDPVKAVKIFANTASGLAWELIQKLAVVPVNLPIVRVIQQELLSKSTPTDIAEILLSGFLEIVNQKEEMNFDINPNTLYFEFVDNIRDILLEYLGKSRAIDVIAALSEYIAKKLGITPKEFQGSIVSNPEMLMGKGEDNLIRMFALVSAEVFSKLGEEHSELVAGLKNSGNHYKWDDFIPELKYQKWKIDNIVEEVVTVEVLRGTEELLFQRLKEKFPFSDDGELYWYLRQGVANLSQEYRRILESPGITPESLELKELVDLITPEVLSHTLSVFHSETVLVNITGTITERKPVRAYYYTENVPELNMMYIPGGQFWMGTEEEEIARLQKKFDWEGFDRESPRHLVKLESFYLSQTPITQVQWRFIAEREDLKAELDLNPNLAQFKGDNLPVEHVNWFEAVEFCQRLSRLTGKNYKLPSEAQWEYACRAIQNEAQPYPPFHYGETLTSDLANYRAIRIYADEAEGEYREQTTLVRQFDPNAFGLYDMHGNVWEWCEDDWHENYQDAPTDGSARSKMGKKPQKDSYSVLRGGSWNVNPVVCRSACRYSYFYLGRDLRVNVIGFRVLCVVGRTR